MPVLPSSKNISLSKYYMMFAWKILFLPNLGWVGQLPPPPVSYAYGYVKFTDGIIVSTECNGTMKLSLQAVHVHWFIMHRKLSNFSQAHMCTTEQNHCTKNSKQTNSMPHLIGINKKQFAQWNNTSRRWQLEEGIWMVQQPGECFWSGTDGGFIAISATSSGHTVMLTSRFDF